MPLILHSYPTVTYNPTTELHGAQGQAGWWLSLPLIHRAQVLQQTFSFCLHPPSCWLSPHHHQWFFCYLFSSGPVILARTKQLPRETIIPKNQGSICSATGKRSHSCCILPHVTAVRPTWAWIRMSEYVLRKKQTNLDYLTKVFPLGTWPLQTVPDKSWFTALANDKSKQRKWCRITECTQILPCMQSHKMTELWSSAHRRGGWQCQVNAKPMKETEWARGTLWRHVH